MKHQNKSAKYIENTKNSFHRYILPTLGHLPITQVTKADILVPLTKLAEEQKYTSHNDLLRLWSVFVNELEVDNVAQKIKRASVVPKGARMSESEVATVLRRNGEVCDPFRCLGVMAADLAITTLVRSGVCAAAKATDFNLAERSWIIPADNEKGRLPYAAPLNDRAIAVVKAALERRLRDGMSDDHQYLFRHRDDSSKHMLQTSVRSAWNRMKWVSGFGENKTTLHNARHSAVTILAKHDVDPAITDKILQHRVGAGQSRIANIYQGHDFMSQRRSALELWGEILNHAKCDSPAC